MYEIFPTLVARRSEFYGRVKRERKVMRELADTNCHKGNFKLHTEKIEVF